MDPEKRPDEPTTTQTYLSGEYLSLNPTYHVEDSKWKAAQVHRLLSANGVRAKSIVEVGCGAGEILAELARLMPETVRFEGWDVSADAIALAMSRSSEVIRFTRGDFLAENHHCHEVLLCLDVFEHVEDYIGFVRKLRGHAEWKVFHIPLDLSVQSVMRGTPIEKARRRLGHLHYFTKETALGTLRLCGYEIVAWAYTAGALDLPDRSLLQNMARLPRRLMRVISPDLAARWLGGFSLAVLAR